MSLLQGLFGGEGNQIITILIGLGIVLILIVFGVWALKLLLRAGTSVGRGRNRRLLVIDSTAIDQKRQLVLIRRDNVEHLLMTGGAHDLVVETGIEPPPEPDRAARQKRGLPGIAAIASAARKDTRSNTADIPEVAPAQADPEPANAPKINPADRVAPLDDAGMKRPSLRYTGLLRSSSRTEPSLAAQPSGEVGNNPEAEKADSDTTGAKADTARGSDDTGDKKQTSTKAG